ncbi:MAG TPA: hypothetical protein VGD33_02930, partial [Chitinophagaceae bacterium]
MKRIIYLCLSLFIIPVTLLAQPTQDSLNAGVATDTTSLWNALIKGNISGHARYYFMATNNQYTLTDYWAHAAGSKIKYESAPFKHFTLGLSFSFAANLGSSDLSTPDPATNQL